MNAALNAMREEAVALIERALAMDAPEFGEEVDEAERAVAHLRDRLIQELRGGKDEVREPLNIVNAALSLVVGVEYSSAGLQRKPLEQARNALREIQFQ